MYKMCLTAVLSAFCCSMFAKTVTLVRVEHKSGEEVSFLLDETGQMSFENRSLLIQKNENDETTSINLNDVAQLNFFNQEVSGLAQVSGAKLNVYPNPVADVLSIEAEGTVDVRIISADGKVIINQKVSDKGEINVSSWASGVYWVIIGNQTFKIEKL